jgi:hypothetical protein
MHHPRGLRPFHHFPDPPHFQNLERLEDDITELAAHIHAATFQLLELIAEYDEQQGWAQHGLNSCAHWLQWKCGTNLGAAREKVRVARALPDLPRISAAFRMGSISYSKVRAMTRVATPKNEEFLLGIARHGTAAHVETVVRNYRRHQRREALEIENERYAGRELGWFLDADGLWVLKGRFTPEQGALIRKALEGVLEELFRESRCEAQDVSAETPDPIAARRADALERMAESYLSGIEGERSGGDRYLLHVHTDSDTLREDGAGATAECEDCGHVSAETSRRMACDASVVHWRESESGEPLSIGRKSRSIHPALRRALQRRDGGCRFPGCSCRRFVDAHHIVHWADGGETSLDNLVLLCRRHHRLVHEGGFGVRMEPGGEVCFSYPDRDFLPATADGRFRGNVVALRVANARSGLRLTPQTLPPDWRGERMDADLAQLAMQSRE